MTKADLVEEVSRVSELTKKDAELIVETVFLSVIRALHAGDKVELRGVVASPARAAIPRPAIAWTCPPSTCRTSSPARN